MRRTPMRRTPFARKPLARSVRRRLERPGVTPAMPTGWLALAREIRERDGHKCRRCDTPAPRGPVNHVIPRRLFPDGASASDPVNLALLCLECHAWCTSTLEPALYQGDVLAFSVFLGRLAKTGPVPPPEMRGAAYIRLTLGLTGASAI